MAQLSPTEQPSPTQPRRAWRHSASLLRWQPNSPAKPSPAEHGATQHLSSDCSDRPARLSPTEQPSPVQPSMAPFSIFLPMATEQSSPAQSSMTPFSISPPMAVTSTIFSDRTPQSSPAQLGAIHPWQ